MYIYIYIYIICKWITISSCYGSIAFGSINFKAIKNVLDAKMVLKTHLFIKIFRFLYRSLVNLYIYIYYNPCLSKLHLVTVCRAFCLYFHSPVYST